jgi:hypothetical protein
MSSAEVSYLTAEIYDTNTIKLYWGGGSGTVVIEQSIDKKNYTTIATTSSNPYTVTGLTSNVLYYFRATSTTGSTAVQTNITVPYNAELKTFYSGKVTSSEIPLYWSGSFYSVKIQYKRAADISYKSLTLTGKVSYQLTNLDADTEYNIILTPIYLSGEESDTTYSIDTTTDYVSYVDISLASVGSDTATMTWWGYADYIKFQASTDSGDTYTTYSTYNSYSDTSGTAIVYGLTPYTTYYFRAVPYNVNFEPGNNSTTSTGTTYAGITDFYSSNIKYNQIVLNWAGNYDTVKLYKSYDGGATYNYLTEFDSSTKSYTDTNVAAATTYYYYLITTDSNYGVDASSSILECFTDYNNYIDAAIDAVTKNSMILRIYSTSVFVSALVQISASAGETYYDLSYLTQNPADGEYTYYATTYDGTNALENNTQYTLKITPYGLYGNSGEYITLSNYTLGTISTFDLSSVNTTTVKLSWSGTYSTATIKYGTNSTLASATEITGLTDTSYVLTVPATTSYYYCVVPVNEAGVDGSASSILFNPIIYSIYFTDASSSRTTLRWEGTYSTYTLQTTSSSTGTYSNVDGYTNVSSPSYYTAALSTNEVLYARVIPYSEITGQTSSAVYNPIVMDLGVPTMDASKIVLYWRGSGGSSSSSSTYNYVKLSAAAGSAAATDISAHIIGNTITINSTYISGIDPKHTSYTFYLTPYAVGYKNTVSFDTSGAQYSLTTPAVSYLYLSDISYLTATSSTKMTLNWSGKYTGLYIYNSTDGGATYSKLSTIGNYSSYTYATTTAGTTYYKVQPYYSTTKGVMSDAVYVPSITDISISQISYLASGAAADSLTLAWVGTYGNVTVQYSTNNSTFYDLSRGFAATSFVVDATVLTGLDLSSNIYYFRATPYCSGVGTGAAKKTTGLTTSAVYNTLVNTIYLADISSSTATLYLAGTFDKVVVQYSTDGGSTFSNLSGYLPASTTSVALSVSSSTSYYYRAVPYYYTKSGAGNYSACITSSTVYVPTISAFYVSAISSNSVEVTWAGTYDEATLEYSSDGGDTWTSIYTITSSSGSLTVDNSYISGISPQYQTYYFRATPYSTATGVQQTTYTPSITYINIPTITSSSITLEWTGTYDTVDIESSTDGSTWSTLYSSVSASTVTFSTSGYTTKYYRVIPYNSSSPQIAGLTSDSVYIPTAGTISSTASAAQIVLTWSSGTYDSATIQYSTDNSTFADLVTGISSGTYTYTIDSSVISGLNATTNTYYFRIVPYTYSYSSGSTYSSITGLYKNSTYNATITDLYTGNTSDFSTSKLLLYYTAVFDTAIVYYGVSAESLTTTASITTDISGTSYLELSSLKSNTTYYFVLVPYNNDSTAAAGAYDISANGTTQSIVSGLSLTYDSSNSTYKSVSLTWTDTGYDYVKLYDLSTNTLVYTGSATSYDSSGIENLASNSTYTYYAAVYDTAGNMETTSNVDAYTYASSADVSMSYSNVESTNSLSFSWRNNYTTLSIYNYTLYGSSPAASNITTYSGGAGGTTTYNSYVDASDSLSYNTAYTYQITLTNKAGSQTIYYITGYTLASATLNVSFDSTRYTSSAIGVDVSGSYSGFILYTNDDGTGLYTYGNTYTVASSAAASLTMNRTNSIVAVANHQYSFKVRPYNMVGTYSSISSTAVAAKTLGSITKFYLVSINDVSSINLYWDGSFSKVALESATNAAFTANYSTTQISGVRATTYTAAGLSSNQKYYFRVTPLNTPVSGVMGDISGTQVTNDVSGTTKVYISYLNYTNLDDISADTIVLQWDGTQTTAAIQYSTDGGSTYKTAGTYSGTYQAISGLNANTTYVFRALGYNSAGVPSSNYSNTVTAATRGAIRNFYISSIVDSSTVTFYIDGSFNRTIIVYANSADYTRNVGSTSFTAATNKYYTLSGLNSNATYYFRAYPVNTPLFNTIDACGNASADVSGITYGALRTFAISSADLSYNGIAVTVDGSYSQLLLEQSSDGGSSYSTVGYYDSSIKKITTYNLAANKQYYFRGTIQNSSGVSSSSVTTNAYTLGRVTSFYEVAVVDSSAIKLYVDGSYSRVVIENTTVANFGGNITAASTTVAATTYTISGLSANKKYYFRATPINNPLGTGDISGVAVKNDVSGITLATMSTPSATTTKSTSILLNWTGTYKYVYFESATSADFSTAYTTATVYDTSGYLMSGLSANQTYYIRTTPVNSAGVSGTSLTTNATTLGSQPTISVVSKTPNTVTLYVTGGSYTTARIFTSLYSDMSVTYAYADYSYNAINNQNYVAASLSTNTQYYFMVTPYNSSGTAGTSSSIVSQATLGNLTAFSVGAAGATSSTIPLTWSGTYSSVYLQQSVDQSTYSTILTTTDTSYVVTGLSSNTKYYYRATPVSVAGDNGTTLGDISSTTLSTITKAQLTWVGDVSAQIIFDGSFTALGIYTADHAIDLSYGAAARTTALDISGLYSLTTYNVYLCSFNSAGVVGDISFVSFTTLPQIRSFSTTAIDMSAIYVAWDGSFNTVKLQWRTAIQTYTDASSTTLTGKSTTINNLWNNTIYYFIITPYATSGAAGYTYATELSNCTYPTLSSLTTGSVSESSIALAWRGNYNYVVLQQSTDRATYTSSATTNSSATQTGLSPNTKYYYNATPVNLVGVSGGAIYDVSTTTLGLITSLSIVGKYDTSAQFFIDGSFATLQVYSSPASQTVTYNYVSGGITTGAGDFTGLSSNAQYVFYFNPYNTAGVGRTDPSSVSFISYPKITSYSLAVIDNSAITVTWDGSYDSVNIYYSTTAGSYTGTAATYTTKKTATYSLASNTTYYFKITPISSSAGAGTSVVDISALTNSYIKSFTVTAADSSSIVLVWDGSYDYVNVYSSTTAGSYTGSATAYTARTATITGLTGNTRYYYKIDAMNASGKGNFSVQDSSALTYAMLSYFNVSVIDTSSVVLTWDGSYSQMYIVRSQVGFGSYDSTTDVLLRISSKTHTMTKLSSNTTYYFRATPMNADGSGVSIDVSAITYPYVKSFTAARYDASAVTLTWDGSYAALQVYASTTAGSYTGAATTYAATSAGQKSVIFGGLAYNTIYYFKAVPTNEYTGTAKQDVSAITYPYISTFAVTYTGQTSAIISYDGSFTSLDVSVNGVKTRYYSAPGTTGTDISNLTQSTTYTVNSTAYGKTGLTTTVAPFTFVTISQAFISGITTTVNDISTITLSWTQQNVSYVNITWNTSGTTYYSTDSSGTYTTNSATITNLSYNTKYYFKLDAYNQYNILGTTVKDISGLTYGYIKSATVTPYDLSAATVVWDGSYASVKVYWSTTAGSYSTYSSFSSKTSAIIAGLSSNATYYFKVVAINSTGTGAIAVQDISALTYPYISRAATSIVDISTITVSWDGSFSSVNVYWSTTPASYTNSVNVTGGATSQTFTALTYNTRYYYRVEGVNITGTGTITKDASGVTYGYISSLTATAYDTSSVTLTWDGSFSTVKVYWSTTASTYTSGNVVSFTSSTYSGLIKNQSPNTTYYYKATANNDSGEGSIAVQDVSALTYPTVTSLKISTYDSSSVTLVWDGSFASVNIYYNQFAGNLYASKVTTDYSTSTAVSYTGKTGVVSGLSPINLYYFKVQGYNATGLGTYKQDVSALLLGDMSAAIYGLALYT